MGDLFDATAMYDEDYLYFFAAPSDLSEFAVHGPVVPGADVPGEAAAELVPHAWWRHEETATCCYARRPASSRPAAQPAPNGSFGASDGNRELSADAGGLWRSSRVAGRCDAMAVATWSAHV